MKFWPGGWSLFFEWPRRLVFVFSTCEGHAREGRFRERASSPPARPPSTLHVPAAPAHHKEGPDPQMQLFFYSSSQNIFNLMLVGLGGNREAIFFLAACMRSSARFNAGRENMITPHVYITPGFEKPAALKWLRYHAEESREKRREEKRREEKRIQEEEEEEEERKRRGREEEEKSRIMLNHPFTIQSALRVPRVHIVPNK